MKDKENYVPYSEAWVNEVMKMSKKHIIENFLAPALKKIKLLESSESTEPVEGQQTYIIYEDDKVNSLLSVALRNLSNEQLIVLRDSLIERTSPVEGEWVRVEDRLPNDTDNVLVYANKLGERIDVAFYNEEEKEWQGLNDFWTQHITHWMPLPPPPNNSNGG